MKRILLAILLIVFVVSAIAYWVYSSQLQPKKVQILVQQKVEEAIGRPIEIGTIRGRGMLGYEIENIRIQGKEGEKDFFTAKSAKISWGWPGAVLAGNLDLKVELVHPIFTIRRTAEGWVVPTAKTPRLVGESTKEDESAAKQRAKDSNESSPKHSIHLVLNNSLFVLEDEKWGEWEVRFDNEAEIDFSQGKSDSGLAKLILQGSPTVSGTFLEGSFDRLGRFPQKILTTVDPHDVKGEMAIAAEWDSKRWQIGSLEDAEVTNKIQTPRSSLEIGSFRLAGTRSDSSYALDDISLTGAIFRHDTWDNPIVKDLRIPWTAPPRGELEIRIEELGAGPDSLLFHVVGVHIESATLDLERLPWLAIVSHNKQWNLANMELESRFRVDKDYNRWDWSDLRLLFSEGREGEILSRGYFDERDGFQWKVDTRIERLPLPDQVFEEETFEVGTLSGTMSWGETRVASEGFVRSGSGSVSIKGGEIGSIRLLGQLEELTQTEKVGHSKFENLSFDFDYSEDKVEIENLNIRSSILDLTGNGVYDSSGKIEVNVAAEPSKGLIEILDREKAESILASLGKSGPVDIRITGSLDSPDYTIIPRGKIRIPLGDLLSD